ncbi:MAG: four helix bundle protein [Bacteroidetes bacterium]|nr:four helix bundle protein [Bacteroidota bacterium]
MKEDNQIQVKSYAFALSIIKLFTYLYEKKKEYVLSKQVLKSGTSIGANVEEAIGAQSKADFICKLAIAYKEARETHYWIRILRDSKYITEKQASSILKDLDEILKIIAKIQITLKKKPT